MKSSYDLEESASHPLPLPEGVPQVLRIITPKVPMKSSHDLEESASHPLPLPEGAPQVVAKAGFK